MKSWVQFESIILIIIKTEDLSSWNVWIISVRITEGSPVPKIKKFYANSEHIYTNYLIFNLLFRFILYIIVRPNSLHHIRDKKLLVMKYFRSFSSSIIIFLEKLKIRKYRKAYCSKCNVLR